jgi:hypothetical protein
MSDSTTDAEPAFEIAARPQRRYTRGAGVEYVGGTVFSLVPDPPSADEELVALAERVLNGDAYDYGDWLDLPMALYSVHDRGTGDVFRVSVRDGAVELHVLPETDPAGLSALYRRLCDSSDREWHVERRTDDE